MRTLMARAPDHPYINLVGGNRALVTEMFGRGDHTFTELRLTERTGFTLADPVRGHSRAVISCDNRDLEMVWQPVRLFTTLDVLEISTELWNAVAAPTQDAPLQAAGVQLRVLANSWADVAPKGQLFCTDLASLELIVRVSRQDAASAFRLRPVVALMNAVTFSSDAAELVLERLENALTDQLLANRIAQALPRSK